MSPCVAVEPSPGTAATRRKAGRLHQHKMQANATIRTGSRLRWALRCSSKEQGHPTPPTVGCGCSAPRSSAQLHSNAAPRHRNPELLRCAWSAVQSDTQHALRMRETLRRIQSKADGPRVSQASHARQPRQAGNRRSGVETRQTRQPPRDAGRPAWPAWARRAIFTPGGRDRLAEHQIQGFSQFPGAPGATGAATPRAGYSGTGSFLTQGRRGRAGLPTAALASLDGHGEPGRRTRRASVTPRAAGSGDAVAGRAGAPKGGPVWTRAATAPPPIPTPQDRRAADERMRRVTREGWRGVEGAAHQRRGRTS